MDDGSNKQPLEFRILGNLEASVRGIRLTLGGLREEKVLAILLLNAGRMVPLNRLVDALWDDNPPATARKQARNAVSRLRHRLNADGVPQPIVTAGDGYQLVIAPGALDAHRFERWVAEAGQAAEVGDPARAVVRLQSALALWRGPALAGLPGRIIANASAAWDERLRAAREAYCECELALGRNRQVISELTAVVRDDPLSERSVAQLMLALYRNGRQADALALYSRTRRLLAEGLGLDPSRRLQALHLQILSGEGHR